MAPNTCDLTFRTLIRNAKRTVAKNLQHNGGRRFWDDQTDKLSDIFDYNPAPTCFPASFFATSMFVLFLFPMHFPATGVS